MKLVLPNAFSTKSCQNMNNMFYLMGNKTDNITINLSSIGVGKPNDIEVKATFLPTLCGNTGYTLIVKK